MAQLEAKDLDAAMMRYKEAKLTYEQLSEYGQNEAYPDLDQLLSALDSKYFQLLAERIHEAINEGRLNDAVDDFARLEGTYERLSPEEQESLVVIVLELGRRLGLSDEEETVTTKSTPTGGETQ